MPEEQVGTISTFFVNVGVAGVDLSAPINTGDRLHIRGHTTDIELVVESMQIDNANVQEGKSGDAIGIKVPDRVRQGDKVYKVTG
ncbi:MAG: translation elongation factor-like protein [Chloroflexi bacterium]|jgi:hypothetical protein|nr:translation elongation factor-like protein [Chloroflexota bacterium]